MGKAGRAPGWAAGGLTPVSPPPQVRADPRQLRRVGRKHGPVLKHLERLGAGCQEVVGRSQHWGRASPWGERVSREPPCQT